MQAGSMISGDGMFRQGMEVMFSQGVEGDLTM